MVAVCATECDSDAHLGEASFICLSWKRSALLTCSGTSTCKHCSITENVQSWSLPAQLCLVYPCIITLPVWGSLRISSLNLPPFGAPLSFRSPPAPALHPSRPSTLGVLHLRGAPRGCAEPNSPPHRTERRTIKHLGPKKTPDTPKTTTT